MATRCNFEGSILGRIDRSIPDGTVNRSQLDKICLSVHSKLCTSLHAVIKRPIKCCVRKRTRPACTGAASSTESRRKRRSRPPRSTSSCAACAGVGCSSSGPSRPSATYEKEIGKHLQGCKVRNLNYPEMHRSTFEMHVILAFMF